MRSWVRDLFTSSSISDTFAVCMALPIENHWVADELLSPPSRAARGDRAELVPSATSGESTYDGRCTGSGGRFEMAGLDPFVTEVEQRDDITIVQPRGDLDIATTGTLRAALDGIERSEHIVLDLRGLSFIDSTGLHLLVALHQRAQRDGFQLTLLAPAAPVDQAIQLCGLDEALPFVEVVDAVQGTHANQRGHRDGM